MKELLPFKGGKTARDRIDEIFSRKMLGSVIVGSSFFKVIENSLKLFNIGGSEFSNLILSYSIVFVISVVLFAYWDEIERAYKEKQEEREPDTEDKIKENVEEKMEEMKEKYDREMELGVLGKKISLRLKSK